MMIRKLDMPLNTKEVVDFEGICPICDTEVIFTSDNDWYRDHLICPICRSLPRHRAFFHVLTQNFPEYRKMRIHESSPIDYIAKAMFEDCIGYSASHFWTNLPLGSWNGNLTCQDIERMTFPDGFFDLFVTMDVMEHLLNPVRALREIKRVLKPGGAYIFTVPIFDRTKSILRAYRRNGQICHVLPPDYHGNPIGNGALVTWEWGQDIADHLGPLERFNIKNEKIGVIGEMTDVLIIRKYI